MKFISLNKFELFDIPLTLIAMMANVKVVTKIATLRSGRQYWMMMPAAVRLLGRTIAYLRK